MNIGSLTVIRASILDLILGKNYGKTDRQTSLLEFCCLKGQTRVSDFT
jgi:hypothetical protein